jgi:3-hydroxyacyl-CoA dehydrogenase
MSNERDRGAILTVVDGGTMGSGFAQIAATSGLETRLDDVSRAQLDKAKSGIHLQRLFQNPAL